MTPTATLGACALLLGLAACSPHGTATSAATSSSGATATKGTITGIVRMYGGPMNPDTGKQTLNGSPGANWPVRVVSAGRTVAVTRSDATGAFQFRLAPGRYTLECAPERYVLVRAGQTVSVNCDVAVP